MNIIKMSLLYNVIVYGMAFKETPPFPFKMRLIDQRSFSSVESQILYSLQGSFPIAFQIKGEEEITLKLKLIPVNSLNICLGEGVFQFDRNDLNETLSVRIHHGRFVDEITLLCTVDILFALCSLMHQTHQLQLSETMSELQISNSNLHSDIQYISPKLKKQNHFISYQNQSELIEKQNLTNSIQNQNQFYSFKQLQQLHSKIDNQIKPLKIQNNIIKQKNHQLERKQNLIQQQSYKDKEQTINQKSQQRKDIKYQFEQSQEQRQTKEQKKNLSVEQKLNIDPLKEFKQIESSQNNFLQSFQNKNKKQQITNLIIQPQLSFSEMNEQQRQNLQTTNLKVRYRYSKKKYKYQNEASQQLQLSNAKESNSNDLKGKEIIFHNDAGQSLYSLNENIFQHNKKKSISSDSIKSLHQNSIFLIKNKMIKQTQMKHINRPIALKQKIKAQQNTQMGQPQQNKQVMQAQQENIEKMRNASEENFEQFKKRIKAQTGQPWSRVISNEKLEEKQKFEKKLLKNISAVMPVYKHKFISRTPQRKKHMTEGNPQLKHTALKHHKKKTPKSITLAPQFQKNKAKQNKILYNNESVSQRSLQQFFNKNSSRTQSIDYNLINQQQQIQKNKIKQDLKTNFKKNLRQSIIKQMKQDIKQNEKYKQIQNERQSFKEIIKQSVSQHAKSINNQQNQISPQQISTKGSSINFQSESNMNQRKKNLEIPLRVSTTEANKINKKLIEQLRRKHQKKQRQLIQMRYLWQKLLISKKMEEDKKNNIISKKHSFETKLMKNNALCKGNIKLQLLQIHIQDEEWKGNKNKAANQEINMTGRFFKITVEGDKTYYTEVLFNQELKWNVEGCVFNRLIGLETFYVELYETKNNQILSLGRCKEQIKQLQNSPICFKLGKMIISFVLKMEQNMEIIQEQDQQEKKLTHAKLRYKKQKKIEKYSHHHIQNKANIK